MNVCEVIGVAAAVASGQLNYHAGGSSAYDSACRQGVDPVALPTLCIEEYDVDPLA